MTKTEDEHSISLTFDTSLRFFVQFALLTFQCGPPQLDLVACKMQEYIE